MCVDTFNNKGFAFNAILLIYKAVTNAGNDALREL